LENLSISNSVEELAVAGERAGFSSGDMIFMLNAGISAEMLIYLIQWGGRNSQPTPKSSSRWVI
jgi:hypothetical protein